MQICCAASKFVTVGKQKRKFTARTHLGAPTMTASVRVPHSSLAATSSKDLHAGKVTNPCPYCFLHTVFHSLWPFSVVVLFHDCIIKRFPFFPLIISQHVFPLSHPPIPARRSVGLAFVTAVQFSRAPLSRLVH